MIEQELLLRIYSALHNWRAVAELLSNIYRADKSFSWWAQVADGRKTPTHQDINAIRACFPGMPEIPLGAGELCGAYGITRAVVAAQNPDTAVLCQAGNEPIGNVVLETATVQPRIAASRLVTSVTKAQAKRGKHQGIHGLFLSNLSPKGLETIHGKTGNLEAIAAAAQQARDALDAPLTDDDVGRWLAAL
jgi:hypothetical protein